MGTHIESGTSANDIVREHKDIMGWVEMKLLPEDARLFEAMLTRGKDAQSPEIAQQLSVALGKSIEQGDYTDLMALVMVMRINTDLPDITMDTHEPVKEGDVLFSIVLHEFNVILDGQEVEFNDRLFFSTKDALQEFLEKRVIRKLPPSIELVKKIEKQDIEKQDEERGKIRKALQALDEGHIESASEPLSDTTDPDDYSRFAVDRLLREQQRLESLNPEDPELIN